jgi:hypothetical protein
MHPVMGRSLKFQNEMEAASHPYFGIKKKLKKQQNKLLSPGSFS